MEEVPKTKYRRLEGGGKGGGEKQHLVSDGRRERSPPHGISHHHDHGDGDADAWVKEAPYGEEGKKSFGPPPPGGGWGEKKEKGDPQCPTIPAMTRRWRWPTVLARTKCAT